jgi:hypothetical protein
MGQAKRRTKFSRNSHKNLVLKCDGKRRRGKRRRRWEVNIRKACPMFNKDLENSYLVTV